MRILITGGAGFIGSNLIEHWLPQGHEIFVIDNFATGKCEVVPEVPGLAVKEGSIVDQALVDACFAQFQPEGVIHAAAAYLLAPRILGRTEAGLAAAGTVEATEVQLGFQSAGRIESLGPREGERVKAGAVMGQLDRAEMLARRGQAQAQLASAQAVLRELQSGFRSEEVALTRSRSRPTPSP